MDPEGVECLTKNRNPVVVKAEDLQDEVWVKCTYTYKEGNMNLPNPRRGRRAGMDMRSMLMMMMMGVPLGYPDSDDDEAMFH